MSKLKFAALALVMAGSLAQAQGHGPRGGMMMMGGPGMLGAHAEHMLDAVDATDAQRAQIKQIMDAARADLKATHESARALHAQSLTLYAAANIDAVSIEALRQQQQALHETISKRMSQAFIDAARVLTPEQRAKLAERMKKQQARMAERMKAHSH
ncbi:Spy/CpxP family protein refolding chaperone [Paucibacter soli]|uniref:Spy/CpxP family protein refolding chaperone n=1 Tax=Paucibacter soli TaxID=3133433 RepID=UPI0030A96D53